MKKFRITIEVMTNEKLKNIDEILGGSRLYDNDFMGAITKTEIVEIIGYSYSQFYDRGCP